MAAGRLRGTGWRKRFDINLGRDISLLTWAMFVWSIGAGLYGSFWSLFIEETGATPTQVGLIIGLQGILRIAVMLPSGIAADRMSRRFIIWAATAATVPSVLIYFFAQSWWHLIPGVLIGSLAACSVPALSSYVAEAAPPSRRARAFTMVYTVGPSTALIIGPVFGGFLSQHTSLQFLFLPTAIFYAIGTYMFWKISERPNRPKAESEKASYRDALRNQSVLAASVLQGILLFFLTLGITFIPNYLRDHQGKDLATIGRFSSAAAIGSILIVTLVGRVSWVTPARGIAIATGCVGIVCLAVLFIDRELVLLLVFVLRGGFSVAWTLFAAVLGDTVPWHLRGRSFAMAEFIGGIGFAIAPFVAGPLYGFDPKLTMLITGIAVPVLVVLVLLFERRVVRPAMALNAASAATP